MIYRFDALPPNTCYRNEKLPYMSQTISAAEDAIFPPYDLPAEVFGSLDMVDCHQQSCYKCNETWSEYHSALVFHASIRSCKSRICRHHLEPPIRHRHRGVS